MEFEDIDGVLSGAAALEYTYLQGSAIDQVLAVDGGVNDVPGVGVNSVALPSLAYWRLVKRLKPKLLPLRLVTNSACVFPTNAGLLCT